MVFVIENGFVGQKIYFDVIDSFIIIYNEFRGILLHNFVFQIARIVENNP
jgi:hypothetical protein